MIIGIPKEIKESEYRVSMVPVGVEEMCKSGHKVFVETSAGLGSSISDDEYRQSGAEIVADPLLQISLFVIFLPPIKPDKIIAFGLFLDRFIGLALAQVEI